MALIGELPQFNAYQDYMVFSERLEQFFEVNDVAAEKKKAILITCVQDDVYKALRDLCHPAVPKDKTYDELCRLLKKQYVKQTSVIRERCDFYAAKQSNRESVSEWFARIKRLSVDCSQFGDRYEQVLLDRFISGMTPSPVLDRLCEEDEGTMTLQKAVEIASIKESSIRPKEK